MVFATIVVIVGLAWSISTFDMRQVVMPGSVEFELDQPATLNVGYEPMSKVDGADYVSPEEPTMTLSLVSVDSGAEVTLESPGLKANYKLLERQGRMIATADLGAGRWRLVGVAPSDDDRSAVYAYGTFTVMAVVMPILVGALVAAIMGPVGLGCLIVGIVMRVRAGKAVPSPSEG